MAKKKKQPSLRIIPLGGIDEIGKNITVVEYGDDIIVIDCGLSFPQSDMLGVDLVIPDVSYLEGKRDKIRAFFVTHGHEDHIGAFPFVLKQVAVNVPIYATPFTLGLIKLKLKEHRMSDTQLSPVKPGDVVSAGVFNVEFINSTHSICGATALAIDTPEGKLVFTGDFKIDLTPVSGKPIDLQRFGVLGSEGVLALFMDSTNAERAGYTLSESTVGDTFDRYFASAQGRIIVTVFASHIPRMQQVIDRAVKYNRYVVLNGRSIINTASVAIELGELKIPEGRLIDVKDVDFYDEDEIVILTTGSQGESLAGLTRMAFLEHRKLDIRKTDTVIFSSTPVPGNERDVSRVINQLFRLGADVVYQDLDDVHVSGHACREELKLMHALIRPRYFIPVHGECKHLHEHQKLAIEMGMEPENAIMLKNGDVLAFHGGEARVVERVATGELMVDGIGVGDVSNVVLKDRMNLSQDGLVIVIAAIDKETNQLVSGPDIISRGFVYEKESENLLAEAKEVALNSVSMQINKKGDDLESMQSKLRSDLRTFLRHKTKRSPTVLSMVLEV